MISDRKLNEDVKQFFINHSKSLINVDEICSNNGFQLANIGSVPDLNELYVELRKWKRIAQLILNLYNNFEIYEHFQVKFMNEENISEYIRKSYAIKSSNHPYSAYSKPDVDVVIYALYQYALYFLIIQREETRIHLKEIFGTVSLTNYKCSMCDTVLQIDNLKCSVCGEPAEAMIRSFRKSLILSNTETQSPHGGSPIQNENMDNKMPDEVVLGDNKRSNGEWKCKDCESKNGVKNMECVVCLGSRPEIWVCKKCTAHNDKLMEHCVACGGDKEGPVTRVREYCKKCGNSEIIRDGLCPDCLSRSTSWICQYRLCENKNYGDGAYCKHCGLAKGFIAAGGDVERYKDGRMDKIWICDKCNKINKDCSTLICLHCHVKRYLMKNVDSEKWVCKKCTAHNGKSMGCCIACGGNKEEPVNIGGEYCTTCRKNEIIRDGLCHACLSRSTSWICQYRFCANKNYGDGAYCKHCGLAKGFITAGGDVLVRCKDGNVDEIWICDKCDKINEDCFRSVCDWCHDDRFAGFEIVKSVDDCGQAVNDKHINGGKWQCLHCQCRNPSNFMTCAACSQARLQLWTCKKCTLENRISNKRCVGCDYERRLCAKCGNNEITDDQFCGDCAARSPKWQCWYIYCQKINYGDDKYCAHCGLERYPNQIKGAPVWQRKANSIDYKWICDKCGKINHKNATNCNDVTCVASRIMLSNWCPNCGRGNPTKYFASNCGSCKLPMGFIFKQ